MCSDAVFYFLLYTDLFIKGGILFRLVGGYVGCGGGVSGGGYYLKVLLSSEMPLLLFLEATALVSRACV